MPSSVAVHELSDVDRIGETIRRSLPLLSPTARATVSQLLGPANLAIAAGVLIAWVASHAFGVGEAIDVILLSVGALAIGLAFPVRNGYVTLMRPKRIGAKVVMPFLPEAAGLMSSSLLVAGEVYQLWFGAKQPIETPAPASLQ